MKRRQTNTQISAFRDRLDHVGVLWLLLRLALVCGEGVNALGRRAYGRLRLTFLVLDRPHHRLGRGLRALVLFVTTRSGSLALFAAAE